MSAPAAVVVVVPARDEEQLVGACLDAVAHAARALRAAHPEVRTHVVVVLDVCGDDTAAVVDRRPGVQVVTSTAGNVGEARALGVEAASAWASAAGGGRVWIASTDADSEVPAHWLLAQWRLAAQGHHLVVGTVTPRSSDLPPHVLAAWHARHSSADGHEHVHGANLGFSLEAYCSVGGFAPLPAHEDVELVESMRRAGLSHVATGAIDVTTSGRRVGRTPVGFAAYLDELGA
ncbi:glycosyltransferase [Nocardioides sp. Soil774]|uniref:glycosyltransferase n=1 Tax=Nocardioides sp. Soil774 TaxID=1736408 RepID=UPI0009E90C72|nr:glycosyltransferase [Nocardioides sp. Soil774]